MPKPISTPAHDRLNRLAAVLLPAAYLAALVYGRDAVPPGLNNDVAEEALRGLLLVESGRFEAITFSIGNSAETLYLYALAALAKLLGTTTLAVHALGWACALACIGLTARLARALAPGVPQYLALAVGATSLWMFHYARSGLRAIAAPLFCAAFALLLDRAERRAGDRAAGLAAGAVLGLSIYAYTSARVLPIAFLVYAGWRVARCAEARAALLRIYAAIVAGAAVVSIPNLLFFLQKPAEFLTRGSYTLRGGAVDQAFNVFWSALFPFYYPDYYRNIAGPTFFFDGVSAALVAAARDPVQPVLAIALAAGAWQARKAFTRPAAGFLLAVWLTAVLLLGLGGPSLTRMLVVWPVLVILIAAGLSARPLRERGLVDVAAGLVLLIGTWQFHSYLDRFAATPAARYFYGPAATPIGVEAARQAAGGQRVVCVVAKDKGIVDYLTFTARDRVRVVEFNQRPVDPAQVPLQEFRADLLLIEKAPPFAAYAAGFPAGAVAIADEFVAVRLGGR